MEKIVNLRKARKLRERAKDAANAAENRIRHGRTKDQKLHDTLEAERIRNALNQARPRSLTNLSVAALTIPGRSLRCKSHIEFLCASQYRDQFESTSRKLVLVKWRAEQK